MWAPWRSSVCGAILLLFCWGWERRCGARRVGQHASFLTHALSFDTERFWFWIEDFTLSWFDPDLSPSALVHRRTISKLSHFWNFHADLVLSRGGFFRGLTLDESICERNSHYGKTAFSNCKEGLLLYSFLCVRKVSEGQGQNLSNHSVYSHTYQQTPSVHSLGFGRAAGQGTKMICY